MKQRYLLFLALLLAGQQVAAQATLWQPFRVGYVYSFALAPGTAVPTHVHTLRVDSAYASPAGDSVYAFNRLLRPAPGGAAYTLLRSRNNLLGARLRWRPGTYDYYLEANAEPALGGPAAAVALLLRPRGAVGSTWVASAAPALTATLSSRTLGLAGAVPDSVATITLSNGQVVVLSRQHGLLQGPPWLTLRAPAEPLPPTWQRYGVGQPGLGPYDPRTLFALHVGDEVGYELAAPWLAAIPCQQGQRLRRIVARQQTADSLLLRYQEQDLIATTNAPGCTSSPGPGYSAIRTGRWAFSLRTGASPQWPFLGLLAGEYRPAPGAANTWLTGQGYDVQPSASCLDDGATLRFLGVYGAATTGPYLPGLDYLALNQYFAPTLQVGASYFTDYYENRLVYYRRGSIVCGQPLHFAGLLATRAALASAAATLAPNPAATAAMLTLVAATQPGTVLALSDALGRCVWQRPVAAGQTSLPVPLADQPAGLYLVRLLAPAATPLTWKLLKQ